MATTTRTIHLVLLASCSAALVHCAEATFEAADGAFDTGMFESNSMATSAASPSSTDENDTSQTLAMNVDGTLVISSGALDLEASSFVSTVYAGLKNTEALCSQSGLRSAEPVKSPRVDDTLYAWWEFEPEPNKDCFTVPSLMGFGIGEYSSLLDSRVIARGEDPKNQSYSVYLKLDEQSPVWVFGIADFVASSSSEMRDSGVPTTPSDLADGLYSFTGILLIPLS